MAGAEDPESSNSVGMIGYAEEMGQSNAVEPPLPLNGRVSVVGSRGPVEINPRDVMARNADVRSVMLALAGPAAATEVHARSSP